LIAKLARAVHYAHQRGILTETLSWETFLLDAKGEPISPDFGLARLTQTESTVTAQLKRWARRVTWPRNMRSAINNQLTRGDRCYD